MKQYIFNSDDCKDFDAYKLGVVVDLRNGPGRLGPNTMDTFLAFVVTFLELGEYEALQHLLYDMAYNEWESGREAMYDGIKYGM